MNDEVTESVYDRLYKYRSKLAEYNACRDLYDQLFPSCTRSFDGMPTTQSDVYEPERWAQARWEQQKKMRASLEELSAALTDIEGMVEQLTGVYRAVIIRRYLLGETFATIAVKLNYSERHIKRIHRKAIERLMMDGSV